MREPYGILVEFISSYNCGGGFGRIDRNGFVISKWNQCSLTKQWHGNRVEVDKDRGLLGNFQQSETMVRSKTNRLKENSLKTEKVFRRKKTLLTLGTNFRDVTRGCRASLAYERS